MVKQVKNISDDEFHTLMNEANQHPSADDERKAREFARQALSKAI